MRFLLCALILAISLSMAAGLLRRTGAAPAFCSLPADSGPCRALFQRYFYNKDTKKCEQFGYGGCDGNENQFRRPSECEAACGGFA